MGKHYLFIKKVPLEEGLITIDTDQIKAEIPLGYKANQQEPEINYQGKEIVVTFICSKVPSEETNSNLHNTIIIGKPLRNNKY